MYPLIFQRIINAGSILRNLIICVYIIKRRPSGRLLLSSYAAFIIRIPSTRTCNSCEYSWRESNSASVSLSAFLNSASYMKAIWHSFPAEGKPEWLTMDGITSLEKRMLEGDAHAER